MSKNIVVYSQPGCGACNAAKEFLSRKGVEFVVKDIRSDSTALKELVDLGFKVTPVIVVDGESIEGFDTQKIEALLRK